MGPTTRELDGLTQCSRAVAAAGATVVAVDIDGDGARMLASELPAGGGTALAFEADVNDEGAVAGAVDQVISRLGTVDVVHNNAALIPLDDGDVTGMDFERWGPGLRDTGWCVTHAIR